MLTCVVCNAEIVNPLIDQLAADHFDDSVSVSV
jgi:hypothetical protein